MMEAINKSFYFLHHFYQVTMYYVQDLVAQLYAIKTIILANSNYLRDVLLAFSMLATSFFCNLKQLV